MAKPSPKIKHEWAAPPEILKREKTGKGKGKGKGGVGEGAGKGKAQIAGAPRSSIAKASCRWSR